MKVNGHLRVVRLSICITALLANPVAAQQNYAPGVTETEISIGQTMPYSGPASAWGAVGKAELTYLNGGCFSYR
jgi:hypothetical protein